MAEMQVIDQKLRSSESSIPDHSFMVYLQISTKLVFVMPI